MPAHEGYFQLQVPIRAMTASIGQSRPRVYTLAMKTRGALLPAALVVIVFTIFALAGCLLTVGAPLTRKVEPDRWVLEAGGGAAVVGAGTAASAVLRGAGYAYAGRALGKHFELGVLPVFYSLGSSAEPYWSITAPLRWDPFPYEWPAHLLVFAGPSIIVAGGAYGVIMTGAGASWKATNSLDVYGSLSAPLPSWQFITASAGTRFRLSPSFQLGAGMTYTYPGLLTATAAATVLAHTW
jgi:hypothetical protein